jgi:hypothetical protein
MSFAFADQKNDEDYTAKIKEYTTEEFFLTELVDHLPASDTVPTPEKVLGHVIGAPDILHDTSEIFKYMQAVADASPRVSVFSIGRTDEGKEMITVVASDEKNIQRLDRIKEILGLLADPRKVEPSEVEKLIEEAVPTYWLTGALHSPESGAPEMLMELTYRLAVEETEFISAIRKNAIVMITPVLEVDGRDRYVDTYRYKKANEDKKTLPLVYWGNYVAHDNNRDYIGLGLELTNNVLKAYFEWHPVIMHDLHESVPYLYTSTGTGPYNAWLDPITINQWQELAYVEISEMTKQGVPGVWTHGFYDGWTPNYLFWAAMGHNSLGRFYETYGGTGADTMVRQVRGQSKRAWYRPDPPLEVVKWSIRNNVNLQQSGALYALKHFADNRDKYLEDFFNKSRRAVAKATTEGPAAYIIPDDQNRYLAAVGLVNLLRKHGVEIHAAKEEFTINEETFAKGSYIIRMDQPYSRLADMFLDTQYYNPNDPRPYDDTGWTLGAVHDVKTARVMDQDVLQVPMAMLEADVEIKGKLVGGSGAVAYVINNNAEIQLAKLRFDLKEVSMLAAEKSFKIGDDRFNPGTFIIPVEGNEGNLAEKLEESAGKLGLTAYTASEMPEVETHPLAAARIALVHTWIFTQNEGWYRIAFEKSGIPYEYISVHELRDNPDLKSKYDVIIFPPVMFGKAQRLVNGISGDAPIAWKKSEEYPNLGGPDSSDDIRGGIGLEGVLHIRRFVENGGVFIPLAANASLPIDYGMVESVSIIKPEKLKASGVILNARIVDRQSPITYGYGRSLGVHFSGAPVFETGMKAVMGDVDIMAMLMGTTEGRPSGRGSETDPDVIQGRPFKPPKITGAGTGIPREFRDMIQIFMPPDLTTVRVVMRYEQKDKLLVSGLLSGGEELQNRAAVIDVPLGKGHVVLFSINPMWRHETIGSYSLIFNTALNFEHLDAGRTKPKKETEE